MYLCIVDIGDKAGLHLVLKGPRINQHMLLAHADYFTPISWNG